MTDRDLTLTSSFTSHDGQWPALLALTIVWHPDQTRIGAQFVWAPDVPIELCRFAPLFQPPGGAGLPLGHERVSRSPVRLVPDQRDGELGLMVALPDSRMAGELNGRPIAGTARLDGAMLRDSPILTMGRTVVLCLHWMRGLPKVNPVPGLVGVGSAAIEVRDQIRMVAATDLPVLLLGETGTGKEIAARGIHALSRRHQGRLVAVNMAALNESLAAVELFGAVKGAYTGAQADRGGLFAEADDATLFLDEIGNAPASVQPMLLRVLEGGDYRPVGGGRDRRSTARLIAATDQRLGNGEFNQALLRRLEQFVIELPPLRERREDIGVLIVHLLAKQDSAPPLPVDFVTALACHAWPGNIRQLVHVLRRAVLQLRHGVAPQLQALVRDVAPAPASAPPAHASLAPAARKRRPAELTEQELLDAMAGNAWIIQAAAQALHISRPTLYKLLKGHSAIRPAERIPADEIRQALGACENDLARCAQLLQTPMEPLRRHLRQLS